MSKARSRPARGTRDFLPDVARQRNHVFSVIREVYEAYGFEPLATPSIERLDTLMGKYGDEGDQLLFKVLKRGASLVTSVREAAALLQQDGVVQHTRSGEVAPAAEPVLSDMGLRYDLTVPLARVIAQYQGKLPTVFKRYQIAPVWRADTPGKGRFREFYQCDVDIVGSTSRLVEVEVLGAVSECLERLGFADFRLRINHRQLLTAMMQTCGISDDQLVPAIVALDKLDKVGADGVAAGLAALGASPDACTSLLAMVAERPTLDALQTRFADHALGREAVADLRAIFQLAAGSRAAPHLELDITLARGLGYYTGAIFEVAVSDLSGSLGGGGRYDELVGMFSNKQVPACGFAIGVERVIAVMEERGMLPPPNKGLDAVVAAADKERLGDVIALASQLRAAGMRVEVWPQAMKPGKLRKYADENGFSHALWLQNNLLDGVFAWSRSRPEERSRQLPGEGVAAALNAAPGTTAD